MRRGRPASGARHAGRTCRRCGVRLYASHWSECQACQIMSRFSTTIEQLHPGAALPDLDE